MIVKFAQFSPDGPSELLGGERELSVDAGPVATRILPVPMALQVQGDKPMQVEGRAVVGQSLMTQAGLRARNLPRSVVVTGAASR